MPKAPRPKKPTSLTDADASAYVAWCINLTANLARAFEKHEGSNVSPELYASLKALQLEYDLHSRRLLKGGSKLTLPNLPEIPEKW